MSARRKSNDKGAFYFKLKDVSEKVHEYVDTFYPQRSTEKRKRGPVRKKTFLDTFCKDNHE